MSIITKTIDELIVDIKIERLLCPKLLPYSADIEAEAEMLEGLGFRQRAKLFAEQPNDATNSYIDGVDLSDEGELEEVLRIIAEEAHDGLFAIFQMPIIKAFNASGGCAYSMGYCKRLTAAGNDLDGLIRDLQRTALQDYKAQKKAYEVRQRMSQKFPS